MLELQAFKVQVATKTIDQLHRTGRAWPAFYMLLPDEQQQNRLLTTLEIPLSEVLFDNNELLTENLREHVEENRAFATCLVRPMWSILHLFDGQPVNDFSPNPFTDKGDLHPFWLEKKKNSDTQSLVLKPAILLLYEYPVRMMSPAIYSSWGPPRAPKYIMGATLQVLYLRHNRNGWGPDEVENESETGTEYNKPIPVNMLGRGLRRNNPLVETTEWAGKVAGRLDFEWARSIGEGCPDVLPIKDA